MMACLECGIAFSRKYKADRRHRLVNCFCSKRCAYRAAARKGKASQMQMRAAKRRASGQSLVMPVHRCCACGAELVLGVFCSDFCRKGRTWARALHSMRRRRLGEPPAPAPRLCPGCNQWFRPRMRSQRIVFCSRRCARRLRKRDCFVGLSRLPLAMRGELIATLALLRVLNLECNERR